MSSKDVAALLHNITCTRSQGFQAVVNQGVLNVLRPHPIVPSDSVTQISNLNQRNDVHTSKKYASMTSTVFTLLYNNMTAALT
jgi:hypothetical protein